MKDDVRSHHTNPNNNMLIELLPDQLYFGCFTQDSKADRLAPKTSFVSIHNKFHYEPFYEDFGPWNLSVLYRLCTQIDNLIEIEEKRGRRVVLYCQEDGSGQYEKIRVNTAYVLGSYLIIYHGFSADDAYLKLSQNCPKFIGFRDASMGAPQYLLHIHDVLRGIEKALKLRWLDFSDFDYEEYEYYERVENGDFNWIIPGKVLSFCGPHNESREENGYPYHAPDVYFDYFRTNKVSTIVRLNAKNYDAGKFTRAGFDHVDLFFVDGSTPSDEIVLKFLKVVDAAKGGVAVHCKAGLGRTGTLIGCWMMKEFGLTAAECMGWMRVCRPGSVIGPQQVFMVEKQKMCWSLGERSTTLHHYAPTTAVIPISQKEEKRSVRRLANQVDEIFIGESKERKPTTTTTITTRPNILRRKIQTTTPSEKTKKTTEFHDETELDEQGRSQGDRLLALKAKHQHAEVPTTSSSRRFTTKTPQIVVPSQAYLNKNREPLPPSKNSSPRVAYRTRNGSTSNGNSATDTLSRTPASAVFPSMASRRSEATRYLSPTTPIKPMSPASTNYGSDDVSSMRFKSRLRSASALNGNGIQPQISKCTLTAAETKSPRRILSMPSPTTSSKSTSSLKKIQISRPRPYPSTGVRVELCANGRSFEIRPRRETSAIIPGSGLAANTEALLGRRKKGVA